jgi:hypothetical protein
MADFSLAQLLSAKVRAVESESEEILAGVRAGKNVLTPTQTSI